MTAKICSYGNFNTKSRENCLSYGLSEGKIEFRTSIRSKTCVNFERVLKKNDFLLASVFGRLVSDIREVMAKMSLLTGNTHGPNDTVGAYHVPGHGISETVINQMAFRPGNAIMNEIREVYERDKRKKSVVIRGVMKKSEHEVKNIFNGACSYLAVGNIQISECVSPHFMLG